MALPDIPIGTHSFRQLYLYSFASQAEVLHHVRTQALDEETGRLPGILGAWNALQQRVGELSQAEAGIAQTIQVDPIPEQYAGLLTEFASDPLFRKTFA